MDELPCECTQFGRSCPPLVVDVGYNCSIVASNQHCLVRNRGLEIMEGLENYQHLKYIDTTCVMFRAPLTCHLVQVEGGSSARK